MTPEQHYAEAERLLAEGVKVVGRIGTHGTHRTAIESGKTSPSDQAKVVELTRSMDELGKKAMGIWAQAHVHATLAITPFELPAAGFR